MGNRKSKREGGAGRIDDENVKENESKREPPKQRARVSKRSKSPALEKDAPSSSHYEFLRTGTAVWRRRISDSVWRCVIWRRWKIVEFDGWFLSEISEKDGFVAVVEITRIFSVTFC